MKRFVHAFILFLFCLSATAQNLIKNPSGDSALVGGKIPYWQETVGTGWGQRTADPAPFSGVGYFFPPGVATAELSQTISLAAYRSLIDSSVLKLHFEGYVLSYDQSPADESNISIRFTDGTNTTNLYQFGPYKQTVAWLKIDSLMDIAPAATTAIISLKSDRRAGSNNDGYYDELSLKPEIYCLEKTFSVTPDSVSICTGVPVQLCGPAGYYGYVWNTLADTGFCLQASDTGHYQLAALDINNCPISSNIVPVTLRTLPPVAITFAADTICAGDSTQLCAPSGYASYRWNGSNGNTECIQARQAGNYYVSVTDNNGCTVESSREALMVRAAPSVSIIVNGDTLSSFNAVMYQWYHEDTVIPGATSPMYIAKVSGSYSLAVTDANGCKALSSPVAVSVATSIPGLVESAVRVFPNPAAGNIQLVVDDKWLRQQIEIYDVQGKLCFSSSINSYNTILALPAAGVYFLHLVSPAGSEVHKLVRW